LQVISLDLCDDQKLGIRILVIGSDGTLAKAGTASAAISGHHASASASH
jgi:hypothetical protein